MAIRALLVIWFFFWTTDVWSSAEPGQIAPGFTLSDNHGRQVSLNSFKNMTVVLEWAKRDCDFVYKHYKANNMQALQDKYTAKGVVWLTIISAPPGEFGFLAPNEVDPLTKEIGANPTHVLFDSNATVASAYGAQTTPQIVIVSSDGYVVYNGAIDSNRGKQVRSVYKAKTNFVDQALTEILNGQPVSVPVTRPYGCSVP